MRQIVLDTETTGLSLDAGHRIVELACVELVNRERTGRLFHQYFNPERESDADALRIHGLSFDFLSKQHKFVEIVGSFIDFISGAELIMFNAPFDIAFINHELKIAKMQLFDSICTGVFDIYQLAKQKHPGERISVDALCERYQIDNSHRDLHTALVDVELLIEIFQAMSKQPTA